MGDDVHIVIYMMLLVSWAALISTDEDAYLSKSISQAGHSAGSRTDHDALLAGSAADDVKVTVQHLPQDEQERTAQGCKRAKCSRGLSLEPESNVSGHGNQWNTSRQLEHLIHKQPDEQTVVASTGTDGTSDNGNGDVETVMLDDDDDAEYGGDGDSVGVSGEDDDVESYDSSLDENDLDGDPDQDHHQIRRRDTRDAREHHRRHQKQQRERINKRRHQRERYGSSSSSASHTRRHKLQQGRARTSARTQQIYDPGVVGYPYADDGERYVYDAIGVGGGSYSDQGADSVYGSYVDSYNIGYGDDYTVPVSCYTCTYEMREEFEAGSPGCRDPFVPERVSTLQCSTCSKLYIRLGEQGYRVIRGCLDNCINHEDEEGYTRCCQQHLCNGAGQMYGDHWNFVVCGVIGIFAVHQMVSFLL